MTKILIDPYRGVNWVTWNQYKANFHCHTTRSDGLYAPEDVVDAYHDNNYDVLAITDHDTQTPSHSTTYPWTGFGRDPSLLNMLAVEGNEPSRPHHIGSFFNPLWESVQNFNDHGGNLNWIFNKIQDNGGLSQFFHPGRYSWTVEQYLRFFRAFRSSLVGVEVYNQGDRYEKDRELWDKLTIENSKNPNFLLFVGMWGYSNDDWHQGRWDAEELPFQNYQFMLMPDLTEESLRRCMQRGSFYFSYEYLGSGEAKAPRIEDIVISRETKEVTVSSNDASTIEWIADNPETVVGSGVSFDYSVVSNFFRCVLSNSHGVTLTQPWLLIPRYSPNFSEPTWISEKNYTWVKSW